MGPRRSRMKSLWRMISVLARRTLRIAAVLCCLALLAFVPAVLWNTYGIALLPPALLEAIADSPLSWLLKIPFTVVMILGRSGFSFLLDPSRCGWGFCEPSWIGILLALLLMCAGLWALAWLYCRCVPTRTERSAD